MRDIFQFKNGYMIIRMPREIDHHCTEELRRETDRRIEANHVRKLVFDFSETEFMDSSGIGMLIGRCKNLGYSGGSVHAIHLNDRLQKIFMVSGLHKLIPVITRQEIAGGTVDGE